MTSRATAVDAGIGIHGGLLVLVPEELSDGFESSRLGIKQNFCAQMPKLMRAQYNASAFLRVRTRSIVATDLCTLRRAVNCSQTAAWDDGR